MKKKEFDFSKAPGLIEEIQYPKPAKEWRPTKKFLIEVSANLETGEMKGVYYTPKTAHDEEMLSKGLDKQFQETAEYILNDMREEEIGRPRLSDEEYRHMIRKGKFTRTYSNLPLVLRQDTVLTLDKFGPITWNVAFTEIEAKTPTGDEILKKLEKLKII